MKDWNEIKDSLGVYLNKNIISQLDKVNFHKINDLGEINLAADKYFLLYGAKNGLKYNDDKSSLLKIILKTKNDNLFIEQWIRYHADIVGEENLIIFDNGSNEEVLKIYQKFSHINVIGFESENNHIHDKYLFTELYEYLESSCKYYIFLDTDEFLSFYSNENGFCKSEILDELNHTNHSSIPTLWLQSGALDSTIEKFNDDLKEDIKFKLDRGLLRFLQGGKPIVRTGHYNGKFCNHNSQCTRDSFEQKLSRFVVFHLKNISAENRIKMNIQKLINKNLFKSSEDVKKALTKANADLSLLKDSAKEYAEEIRAFFNNQSKFIDELKLKSDYFSLSSKLTGFPEEYNSNEGLVLETFFENENFNNSVKNSIFNDKPNIELKPHMTSQEFDFLNDCLSLSDRVIEFGIGGSTKMFMEANKDIVSFETDLFWLREAELTLKDYNNKWTLNYVNVGEIVSYGYPKKSSEYPNYFKYVVNKLNTITKEEPYLIFNDGRFRVLTHALSLLQFPSSHVIIHDFSEDRPHYSEILNFSDVVDSAGTMHLTKRKDNIDDSFLEDIIEKYKLDPR